MTTFLMMVLPLVSILLIVLAIYKALKMVKTSMKIRWTPKHIVVVVIGYVTLGLVAFLYLNFFYESEITTLSSDEIQKLEQLQEEDFSFLTLTDTYKKKSWQFEFEGDILPVMVNEDRNGLNPRISVRYNDDIKKGSVHISYYQTPVIIEGIDLTDKMPLPNLYMSEEQLIIEAVSRNSISYNSLNPSLSILDFNREIHDESGTVRYTSENVLLIETARSTNLEGLLNILN
ncbi:hypothetical protein ACIQ2D_17945 [Lysinibacillus sp. NPDC097287]|uniref:hypothetical protein n=1 Tax=Lysinibacillus sp. NPDC097287 TaxID=3364144 RepID=UPI0037F7DA09